MAGGRGLNKLPLFIFTLGFLSFLFSMLIFAGPVLAQPNLSASSAILMELESGRVLWEKDAERPWPPASTTKIMTALVVLEKIQLGDTVRISRLAAATEGSSAWLEEGEVLSVRDLLYALLLPSANDAAVALAEKVAGTTEDFVELMNERAQELGAHNSHFVNPHGLPAAEHYSTARDLALIMRAAWKIPAFRQIVGTKSWELPWPGHSLNRLLYNRNRLLWEYPAARGGKTGSSRASGPCLVAVAEERGLTLCAVLLNSQKVFEEAKELFDYGFAFWEEVPVVQAGTLARTVPVVRGKVERLPLLYAQSLSLPLQVGEREQIRRQEEYAARPVAPIQRGRPLGRVSYWLGEEKLGEVTLVAGMDIPRLSLWELFWKRIWETALAAWQLAPRLVK